ncbi:transcription termination/antitermination NusG family protein [Sediminispirochaeta smaragdinae]|jgi:transcriptional antiterminator NusG|uniref:NusG antitermination factor n=1 Tax=Sediminispirochaeta smaragdinae (strain DSM 11293 / JCM 15392 / SEBR 4228) TaxID=573413 RepID=E1R438_SEDSS|nr:transcription termination/antitermination NusG family protein [Sediminispirochaeta smaragdinae]ADK80460.1 NusG antitermination factor [Sediminispirochaeta smaragdinae DSM 11293]
MNYYSMQVITRQEKRFMQLAENAIAQFEKEQGVEITGKLLWPRRSLKIRKRGKTTQEQAPIFPGYLFWQAESLEPEVYWLLKRNSGFIRFLKSNYDIEPLTGASKELLVHFLNYGEVVGTSTVTFGTGDRIVVLSGPMKGLEGNIRKVNKRKGRAKIELMLYEQSFLIDFAFDGIKKAEGKEHE